MSYSFLLDNIQESLNELATLLDRLDQVSAENHSKFQNIFNSFSVVWKTNISEKLLFRVNKTVSDFIGYVKDHIDSRDDFELEKYLFALEEQSLLLRAVSSSGSPLGILASYLDRSLISDDEKEIEKVLSNSFQEIALADAQQIKLFLIVFTSLNLLFTEEFRNRVVLKAISATSQLPFHFYVNFFSFVVHENITDAVNLNLLSNLLKSSSVQKLFATDLDIFQLIPSMKCVFENAIDTQNIAFIEAVCIFIREVFVTDTQLIELFKQINFKLSTPTVHLRCLLNCYFKPLPPFYVFLPADKRKRRTFFNALQQTKNFFHFGVNIIVGDISPSILCKEVSIYCIKKNDSAISLNNFRIKDKSGRRVQSIPIYHLFSNFFFFSLLNYYSKVIQKEKKLFVKILFYLASPSDVHRETTLISNPSFIIKMNFFVDQLNRLSDFGLSNKEDLISTYVLDQLNMKVKSLMGIDPIQALKDIATMIKHLLSINLDYVKFIIGHAHAIGKLASGKAAIQETLQAVFRKWDICDWETINLKERIYYIYCYMKYPLTEFQDWFDSINAENAYLPERTKELLFQQAAQYENHILGIDRIVKYGYKFMQNNQIIAILGAIQATKEGKHYFARLQTGQGKSLVFALLAIHYTVKLRKRVAVFSCYDHLASRDYEGFQPLFEEFGILSAPISSNTESLPPDIQLIYANLSTFFLCFQRGILKKAKGSTQIDLLNLHFDVILLDEFDALILDSEEIIPIIHDFSDLFRIPKFTSIQDAKNNFNQFLVNDPDLTTFLSRPSIYSFHKMMTDKYKDNQGRSGFDYLGNEKNYIGGKWYELVENSSFYLFSSKLYLLAYLLDTDHIIGFSGSISFEGIANISKLFDKKTEIDRVLRPEVNNSNKKKNQAKAETNNNNQICYMNIPCFYGKDNRRNTKVTEAVKLSTSNWIKAIEQDIAKAIRLTKPLLIFGDITKPDEWNLVLEVINKTKGNRELITLTSAEDVVKPRILREACDSSHICFSSHIGARGIDFKVSDEYNAVDGMHVLITYNPNDRRLLTQMIGRTARMENFGSHSIIIKDDLPLDSQNELKLEAFQFEFNQYIIYMTAELNTIQFSSPSKIWKRWILLMNYIIDRESWNAECQNCSLKERVRNTLAMLADDRDDVLSGLRKEDSYAYDIPVSRPKGRNNSGCVLM